MVSYHSHLIAREGWRLIAIAALLGLILQILAGFLVAIPFWIATLGLCVFFRDPKRAVPPKPLAIVSPVDSVVTGIDTLDDPYTNIPMVQIQLRKGFFAVMSTRSPIEGKILKQWFGAVDTKEPAGEAQNLDVNVEYTPASCATVAEQTAVPGKQVAACRFAQWIQSDEQDNVVMVVKSAARFFRPRCYSHSGDRIGQGQRCGIIPFAAVVLVRVPASSRVEVKIGDTVCGGTDTLAILVH